jgi:protein-S-isoprenylcysteine O-methyltransferase Ste14
VPNKKIVNKIFDMKTMSVILKILAVLSFIVTALCFLEGELEMFITLLIVSIFMLATGVLFKNLGEAFEDIALIRKRQKKELISKGILKEEE